MRDISPRAAARWRSGAARRRRNRAAAGDAEYEVFDNHDGELTPTVPVREQIIRAIRKWNADIVLAPRPNDYHPDHRYTGVLVQDAAYMVVVPNICPDTPPLRKNPVFFYYEDNFQKPAPFRPDVAIAIDDVWQQKVDVLDSHVSQFYEWLPWVDHTLESVPKDPAARKEWLSRTRTPRVSDAVRKSLEKWYGAERGRQMKTAESFELCEYGYQPKEEDLKNAVPDAGEIKVSDTFSTAHPLPADASRGLPGRDRRTAPVDQSTDARTPRAVRRGSVLASSPGFCSLYRRPWSSSDWLSGITDRRSESGSCVLQMVFPAGRRFESNAAARSCPADPSAARRYCRARGDRSPRSVPCRCSASSPGATKSPPRRRIFEYRGMPPSVSTRFTLAA